MFLSLFCDRHKNYIIMNDYILIFIVTAYICVGVCLSLEKVDSQKARRDVKLSNIEKRDVL